MNLGDILGLLFLVIFVILPAVQGFLRRSQQMPQDFEPDQIPLPGQRPGGQKQLRPAQPPQAKPLQPQPRANQPQPLPRPAAPQAKAPLLGGTAKNPTAPPLLNPNEPSSAQTRASKTQEELRRERLARKAGPSPTAPATNAAPVPPIAAQEPTFSTEPRAILNGVVWAQILNEPRGRHWRKTRKPRR